MKSLDDVRMTNDEFEPRLQMLFGNQNQNASDLGSDVINDSTGGKWVYDE